jgi:hypothetical protein
MWALAGAGVWSYLGPQIATHFHRTAVGPFDTWSHAVGFVAILTMLAATIWAPVESIPAVTSLGRLLLWAAPPFAAWAWSGAYDPRLLSPAWPPLIILCACALHAAIRGSRRYFSVLAVPAVAAIVIAIVAGLENVDGIGRTHWSQVRAAPSSLLDLSANRAILLPDFAGALTAVRPTTGADGQIFTSDGKFRFFFPGRVTQSYARTCSDLEGYRVFVFLTDKSSLAYMQANRLPTDPAFWSRCGHPRLTRLASSGNEIVFRVTGA